VVQAITADVARTDVLAAYPRATANHGFEWTRTLAAGKHDICFYAINLGAGTANPRFGCTTVTLGGPPVGLLERVTATPGQVQVEGWAVDPDTTDPITVNVYVDGVAKASGALADVDRPDVESARPGSGSAHGFDLTVPVVGGPDKLVCVYANNTGSGSGAPRIGCWRGDVPGTTFLPIGNVDAATPAGNNVTVRGWALDQDSPTEPIRVHVYVDGVVRSGVTADDPRADIGLAYPEAGVNHGWQVVINMPSGVHQVCAYGINIYGGSSNPELACTSVTVP
jgi:hypothetical protein